MEKIETLLQQLPDGYRERALRNREKFGFAYNKEAKDLYYAIDKGFEWEATPEGIHFWKAVRQHYLPSGYDTQPPLPPPPEQPIKMKEETLPYEIGKKYLVKWEYMGKSHVGVATYNKCLSENKDVFYFEDDCFICPSKIDSAEPLPEPKETQEEPERTLEDFIYAAHANLIWAGEHDLAASLKSKHPEIWPVDWEKAVIDAAVKWVEAYTSGSMIDVNGNLFAAVRNYLESKNERK